MRLKRFTGGKLAWCLSGVLGLGVWTQLTFGIETPPAEKNAPAAEEAAFDPYTVPEEGVEPLLDYLTKLLQYQPKEPFTTLEAFFTHYKKQLVATYVAADRVLAQNPTPEQTAKLLEKLGDLSLGDKPIDATAMPALQKKYQLLKQAAMWPAAASDAERTAFVENLESFYADSGAASGQLGAFGTQIGSMLEWSDDSTSILEIYKTLTRIFKASGNQELQASVEQMEPSMRRFGLVGNSLKITGNFLDGTPFDWAPYQGKVVLVDFWSTKCGPCVAELPNIEAQYKQFHDQGFEVVGISLDQNREDLDKFLEERKLPWPILQIEKSFSDPLAIRYGINAIPVAILVGPDGKVLTVTARGEKLKQHLEKLLPAPDKD